MHMHTYTYIQTHTTHTVSPYHIHTMSCTHTHTFLSLEYNKQWFLSTTGSSSRPLHTLWKQDNQCPIIHPSAIMGCPGEIRWIEMQQEIQILLNIDHRDTGVCVKYHGYGLEVGVVEGGIGCLELWCLCDRRKE